MVNFADDTNPFASPEELEKIAKLREHFAEEFSRRQAEGRDYPAFFGDHKLTRVLRGNDGDIAKSIEWFSAYLKMWHDLDLDAKVPLLPDVTANDGLAPIDMRSVPGAKFRELQPQVYNAGRLTTSGDVIYYLPMSEYFPAKVVEQNLFEDLKDHVMFDALIRDLHVDYLSRKQNRLVKIVWIVDWGGISMSQSYNKEVMRYDNDTLGIIRSTINCELVHATIAANTPRWGVILWEGVKYFWPEKFRQRILVLGKDWPTDQFLLRYIGADQIASFVSMRKHGLGQDDSGQNSGTIKISPGGVLERIFMAKEGQRYTWECEVQPGGALVSPPEIDFSVVMIFADNKPTEGGGDAATAASTLEDEQVVPSTVIAHGEGQVSGNYDVKRDGMLMIRWSNQGSWVRAKTIKFAIGVPEADAA